MADKNTNQAGPLDRAEANFTRAVDALNADFFAPAKIGGTPIDAQERERRQKQIDTARASIELEGYKLSGVVEEINRRYIEGEIDGDAHGAAIRAYALTKHDHV
jgi:hypothetical protein